MIRAVAYYRKSNDDRGELGESIDQQREWAQEKAKKLGLVIVREFADQSVSGLETAKRSGFLEMIEFCEQQENAGNPIEYVVCWHANRFSRANSLETSFYLHRLCKAGTTRMLTESKVIDFDNPEDRLLFGLEQEASSHRFSRDLSAATRRGKRAKAAKGKFITGGRPPFGYTRVGEKLIPHEEHSAVVRWLFATYAAGGVSVRGLGDDLHRRGVKSPKGYPL